MGMSANISWWFTEIYGKIDLTKYANEMIGNADETMLSSKGRLKCIISKVQRQAIIKVKQDKEHVTILTMITNTADYSPPLFIFPLKNTPKELTDMVLGGKIIIAGQESGWIDTSIFGTWCDCIIKWIQVRRTMLGLSKEAPFLMFVDSHAKGL